MHDCQRFREDWVDGAVEEASDCEDCRSFCREAAAVLQAAGGAAYPVAALSEDYWDGFEDRLREKLVLENESKTAAVTWKWAGLSAAAAVVAVMTWGGLHVTPPVVDTAKTTPRIEFSDEHIEGLDPMVVAFLGQSELFLRNFTKIEPSYVEDLNDARERAMRDLTGIAQEKELAGDFAPVRITLDEYESVLREIKNLDSFEDLADLQGRIHRNGLIANLKAYQPQVMLVSQR